MQLSDENDLRGRNMVTFLMETPALPLSVISNKSKPASDVRMYFSELASPLRFSFVAYLITVAAVIGVAIALIMKTIRDVNPRKSTIFSHRKNKYKNRIGKNNKKYM